MIRALFVTGLKPPIIAISQESRNLRRASPQERSPMTEAQVNQWTRSIFWQLQSPDLKGKASGIPPAFHRVALLNRVAPPVNHTK